MRKPGAQAGCLVPDGVGQGRGIAPGLGFGG